MDRTIAQCKDFLQYGRLGRLKFLAGLIILMVVIFGISSGIKEIAPAFALAHKAIIGYVLSLIFFTPLYLARIRDSGFPTWFVVISFIPGVSALLTLALLWCKGNAPVSSAS